VDKLSIKLQEMFHQLSCAFDEAKSTLNPASSMANSLRSSSTVRRNTRRKVLMHARDDSDLIRRPAYDSDHIGVWNLLGPASGNNLLTGAFAWVIATRCNPFSRPFVPALGMNQAAFAGLLANRFPHFSPPHRWLAAQTKPASKGGAMNEFAGLLQLLLDHRAHADEHHRNIAHVIAAACMGDNLLWHDLGLPDQAALSALFCWHFPALAERNTSHIQLKTFFYQQLCEREGIAACIASDNQQFLGYSGNTGAEQLLLH
jgi:nitrogen fixation protein NifQ